MSPKASSLAIDEGKEMLEDKAFQPKLEVLVKSRKGLVKCPINDANEKMIKIGGRITISF